MTFTDAPAPGSPAALDDTIAKLADEATTIVNRVEGEKRDFTNEEQGRIKAIFDEAKGLRDARSKATDRAALRDQISGLVTPQQAAELNAAVAKGRPIFDGRTLPTPGERYTKSDGYTGWLKSWPGGVIPDSAQNVNTPVLNLGGIKALVTSTLVGDLVQPDYRGLLSEPYAPLTLRSLVTNGTTTSDTIEYAQVKDANMNAAPVAEATTDTGTDGQKPQSDLSFEKVTSPVRTIAHWLAITKRALADAGQLRTIIDGFLRYGLEYALENQMLNGDGTGENFLGLLNTPGTRTQPWDTDILVTLRRALQQLQTTPGAIPATAANLYASPPPNAVVLNPADDAALDLLRDGNGNFMAGAAAPWTGATPRTIWGLQRVVSNFMPAGTALMGAFGAAVLWDREQTTISATDSHKDWFTRNILAILAECRAAFGVLFPAAFVEVDLTAGV